MNIFSIKEALKFGWETTKKNFWFLVGLTFLVWIVGYLPQIVDGMGKGSAAGLVTIASWLLAAWVQLGAVRILLALVDGKPVSFALLKQTDTRGYIAYLAASVLVGIMVGVGMIIFIIPGVIVALAVGMYGYRIVDAKAGVIDSIKQSAAITRGHRWQLFGLALMMVLLNILGAIVVGLGLLVTVPVTMLAHAYAYRKLTSVLEPVVVSAPPRPAFLDGSQQAPAIPNMPSAGSAAN
ncbi:MAG: DUF975 family protein [Candidatus Andersenbacteria bacterium]|nr:DUF975 family protein [Candidatus Andersenbacteria bacterium]